ncbi:hypothetical protein AB1N83_007189 [Pleurotus pulmonarius]
MYHSPPRIEFCDLQKRSSARFPHCRVYTSRFTQTLRSGIYATLPVRRTPFPKPSHSLEASMTRFKTTWEDLAHLGYSRYDVWDTLNAQRGGTMRGPFDGGVALNEGIALQWSCVHPSSRLSFSQHAHSSSIRWYCYNDYKGPASPTEPVYQTVSKDEVLWEYNNTSKRHVKGRWTGSWKNTEYLSATITHNGELFTSLAAHLN